MTFSSQKKTRRILCLIYEGNLAPSSEEVSTFFCFVKEFTPRKRQNQNKAISFLDHLLQNKTLEVLQNFKIILHVEVFISLYFIICMAVFLMCLQRQDSGRKILNFVMQAKAQIGFKNILLNFSEKKTHLDYESCSTSQNIVLGLF